MAQQCPSVPVSPVHLEEAPGVVFPGGNGLSAVGMRALRDGAGAEGMAMPVRGFGVGARTCSG